MDHTPPRTGARAAQQAARRLLLVAVAYLLCAKGGLALAIGVRQVTAVWPPTGLALAAVLVWGRGMWPGIALGALLANMTTGEPAPVALAIAAGNTLEALAGAWLISRVRGFSCSLARKSDVLALVGLAGVLSTTVSATIGVTSLWLGGVIGHFDWITWRTWWFGDMGGDVLIAPVLLLIAGGMLRRRLTVDARQIALAAGLLAVLAALGLYVFIAGGALPYALFPLLFWVAVRFRAPGAVVANLLLTCFAIAFTVNGIGPFVHDGPGSDLLRAQTFSAVVALTALLVAAAASERDTAESDRAAMELTAAHLQESEQRQRLLLGGLPDTFIALYDHDLRCTLLQGPMLSQLGLTADAFIGRSIEDLLPADRYPHVLALIRGGLRGESGRADYESPLTGRVYEVDIAPYRVGDGPITGAFAVARDITQRLEHEQELRRLAASVEHSADAITSTELDGTIIAWNGGAERLYGHTAADAIGRHISMIVPAHRDGEARTLTERVLAGDTVGVIETERLRVDGTLLDVSLTVSPVLDASNTVVALSAIARDITAQRAAERRLRDQARMLADSQAVAHVGSWEWELSGPHQVWTDELCRMFGLPVGSRPTFEQFMAMVHPDDRQRLRGHGHDDESERGRAQDSEYRIVRRDGAVRALKAHRSGRVDESGRVTRLVGTMQDVTELRAAEAQRTTALRGFGEAQRIAQVGSWTWDTGADTATWSEEMYRIFDRDPADGPATSDAFFAHVHPDDRARLAAGYAETFGGGGSFEVDYRVLLADGTERVLHGLGRADAGRPGCYVGTVQDVTGLRATERALAIAEQQFRETIDGAPIGMALVAPRGRWLRVNRALCEITGYTEAELQALTFQDITHPADLSADLVQLDQLVAGEIDDYQMETRYIHKLGHFVWVQLSVSLLRDETGAPLHLIAQIQDITADKAAREALVDTSQRLKLILENLSGSAVALYDRDLRLRFCEGPLFAAGDLSEMIGRRLPDFVDPGVMAEMTPGLAAAFAGHTTSTVLDDQDGGSTLAVQFTPYRLVDGSIDGVLVHWHDISALREAQRGRDEAQEHFRIAFERAPIGMAVVGLEGRFDRVNDAMCEIGGYSAEDLVAKPRFGTVLPEDVEQVTGEFAAFASGADTVTTEHRIVHASGHTVWVHVRATMIRDDTGRPLHLLAQVQDISERRLYEDGLKHLADHDPLTGLLNRRGLESALESHLTRCRRYGAGGALLMLDLDGFKRVNDTLGHAAGDELIIRTAQAISGRLRDSDVVARLGGDEFAIILPVENVAQTEAVAQALVDTIRESAESMAGTPPAQVTASIGVAMFTDATLTGGDVLACADQAMYEAKATGKDRFAFGEPFAGQVEASFATAAPGAIVGRPPEPLVAQPE